MLEMGPTEELNSEARGLYLEQQDSCCCVDGRKDEGRKKNRRDMGTDGPSVAAKQQEMCRKHRNDIKKTTRTPVKGHQTEGFINPHTCGHKVK